jgi:hypothetical protein
LRWLVQRHAASFRPIDLATLELALARACRAIASTPLPAQPVEGEEFEEISQNTEKNTRQLKQKIYSSQIVPMLVAWGSF